MTYRVEFAVEAAAEFLRLAGVVGMTSAIQAAEQFNVGWSLIQAAAGRSCWGTVLHR